MRRATQPSEDSYFEADGLAAFAASRADGASTRDSLRSSPHAYEHDQLELHTPPARYETVYGQVHPPPAPPPVLPPLDLPARPRPLLHSAPSHSSPSAQYLPHAHSPVFPRAPAFPRASTFGGTESRAGSTPSLAHGLPAFERWSPTWYDGSLSGEGRGVTYVSTEARSEGREKDSGRGEERWRDPFAVPRGRFGGDERYSAVEPERHEPSTDDEREGAQGEWDGIAGEYRHGVGYDSTRPPTAPAQLDRRMERLSRRFGSDAAPSAAAERDAAKARFRAAHEAQKREAAELERKTGVSPRTGRLVVLGPKKRNALRWFEGGGAVIVAVGAIGASLFTHPDPPPAPSGSAPLIALCLAPFPSLLLTLYLFVLRPFLHRRRASRAAASPTGVAPGVYPHLMQPPEQGGRGGCCPCFGAGHKRIPRGYGVGGPAQHGFGTLNFVVDPRLLGAGGLGGVEEAERRRHERRRENRERARRKRRREKKRERRREARAGGAKDEDDGLVSSSLSDSASSLSSSPSSSTSDAWSSRSPTSSRPNPRHALLSHLSHEATWRSARAALKRETGADALCAVAWGALGVWALEGAGGCTPGEGEGFCNLYNTALAFSILLCAAFVGSFTLDCVDLGRTKISPRFRQQRLVGAV